MDIVILLLNFFLKKINVTYTKLPKKNKQTRQVCEVCWSNVLQGVDAHIERFSALISLDKSGPVLKPVEVGPVGTTLPKFNRNTMAFPPWLSGASC